jgi:acylphosphatase
LNGALIGAPGTALPDLGTRLAAAAGMDSDRSGAIETRLVRVRGRVQGVGYRYACVQQARVLGVTGWVRNRMDDSVEAMLQGTPEQLQRMCDWMRDEMPAALVEHMESSEVPAPFPRFDRFEQRPTQ